MFSWRTTLSAHLFNNSPRLSLPTLHSELVFTLLTYGFALFNLARLNVVALGTYERERGISDGERKAKDEKLGFAVTLLCRASGIFEHVSTTVLSDAEQTPGWQSGRDRPPELSKEVSLALSKCVVASLSLISLITTVSFLDRLALASAQSLAIRKLMTRSSYDSIVTPGPPLPASHPSPALLAKLHLEAAALCASAESLMRIPASRKKDMEVTESLLLYAHDAAVLHGALARKWLGAEKGALDASGMAIGFLGWAKRELDTLRDGRVRGGGKDEGRDERRERRGHIAAEAEDVAQFLRYYTRMNDTVRAFVICRIYAFRFADFVAFIYLLYQLSFQPVPLQAELQTSVPAGRLAVAAKAFLAPAPAFGPGSVEFIRKHADSLDLADSESSPDGRQSATSSNVIPSYAGAGSYF